MDIKKLISYLGIGGLGAGIGYVFNRAGDTGKRKLRMGLLGGGAVLYLSIAAFPELTSDILKYLNKTSELEHKIEDKRLLYEWKRDSLNRSLEHQLYMNGKKSPITDAPSEYMRLDSSLKTIDEKVRSMDEHVKSLNVPSQQTGQQQSNVQQAAYTDGRQVSKIQIDGVYIVDIDKSRRELNLLYVTDNTQIVAQYPISIPRSSGPAEGRYNIYCIDGRGGDLYPGVIKFDERKPHIVITGAGTGGNHDYEITRRMNANKTGIRLLNSHYSDLVSRISGSKAYVNIHF